MGDSKESEVRVEESAEVRVSAFQQRMLDQRAQLLDKLQPDYNLEIDDMFEWSFYIIINDCLKLNVSILEDEGCVSTMLYKRQDDYYFQHRDSKPKYHVGNPDQVVESIKAVAVPLVWFYNTWK